MNWILETAWNFCAGVGAGAIAGTGYVAGRRRLLDVKPTKPMLEPDPDWTPWRTLTDWRNAWRFRQVGYRFDRSLRFGAGAWRDWRLTRARRAQALSDLWFEAAAGKRWEMHEHRGSMYAVDVEAAMLTMSKPDWDGKYDQDAYRWDVRSRFDFPDNSWRMITGITAS